jgi:hypothetical protein
MEELVIDGEHKVHLEQFVTIVQEAWWASGLVWTGA